ncbi:hypothetical protein J4Q44_G00224040 [Coregonus suidteri]|uniref:Uncharacterized protein n=1 Tax=Coregonus suidteri TaxID=861788 RepID=A0AAN8LNX8_9TELE
MMNHLRVSKPEADRDSGFSGLCTGGCNRRNLPWPLPHDHHEQHPPKSEVSSCQGDNDSCQDGLSTDNHKVKRFCNTYNILNNSGLLGIALRTKELIRQNRCTQGQMQQLQEQTDLFLEALGSGVPLV